LQKEVPKEFLIFFQKYFFEIFLKKLNLFWQKKISKKILEKFEKNIFRNNFCKKISDKNFEW